jgi:hypothetical protein
LPTITPEPEKSLGDKVMRRKWIPGQFCIAVVLLLACCTPKPNGPITTAFDGVYNGEGYSASPSGDCPAAMPNTTLTVSGGYATFSGGSAGFAALDG